MSKDELQEVRQVLAARKRKQKLKQYDKVEPPEPLAQPDPQPASKPTVKVEAEPELHRENCVCM
jgi:hypothetical protein